MRPTLIITKNDFKEFAAMRGNTLIAKYFMKKGVIPKDVFQPIDFENADDILFILIKIINEILNFEDYDTHIPLNHFLRESKPKTIDALVWAFFNKYMFRVYHKPLSFDSYPIFFFDIEEFEEFLYEIAKRALAKYHETNKEAYIRKVFYKRKEKSNADKD